MDNLIPETADSTAKSARITHHTTQKISSTWESRSEHAVTDDHGSPEQHKQQQQQQQL
jgi:hypothetical protein